MFESTSIVNSTLPAPMIVTFGMRDIVPSGMESNKSRQGASVRRMKRLAWAGSCAALLIVAFGQPVSAAVVARTGSGGDPGRRRSRVPELPGARSL